MKRRTTLALALCISCAAWTQTMKIHSGAVTVAVPVAEAGNMVYGEGGTTLTVMGKTYAISDIDSITVDRAVVENNTVQVTYLGEKARVMVAGNIAPQLQLTVKGADVSAVADTALQKEIVYTLKGSSVDGTFFMEGDYKAKVILENLALTHKNGAAIDIANGKRIDIILPEGTTTTLADGPGTQKACFFVNGHPEFKGGGTLLLTGNAKHAFASDEYTRFKSDFGTLKVLKAKGDGLHIEQYFKMEGGNIHIANTGGDGIDVGITKDSTDEYNGQAFIEGGHLTLAVTADDVKGLKCDSALTLSGGTVEAGVSGLGAKGISVGTHLLIQQKTEVPTKVIMSVTGTTYKPDDPEFESKCRGIKAKGDFTFDGGDIQISATGKKSKAISIDGVFHYISGTRNCEVSTPQGDF